jgi:hypothetical protein
MRSLSIQQAAAEELGVELSDWQQSNIKMVTEERDKMIQHSLDRWGMKSVEEYATGEGIDIQTAQERLIRQASNHPNYFGNLPKKYMPVSTVSYDEEGRPVYKYVDIATERKLIGSMYSNTQQKLSEIGYKADDYVTLYRGYSVDYLDITKGSSIEYHGNAIESWSIDYDVADKFAQDEASGTALVIAMRVPVKNIVSCPLTGFGCLTEGEFVITGNVKGSTAKAVQVYQFDEVYND